MRTGLCLRWQGRKCWFDLRVHERSVTLYGSVGKGDFVGWRYSLVLCCAVLGCRPQQLTTIDVKVLSDLDIQQGGDSAGGTDATGTDTAAGDPASAGDTNPADTMASSDLDTTSPWNLYDIGSRTVPCAVDNMAGVYTVNATNFDIWTNSDDFCYYAQPANNDLDVVARITQVTMPLEPYAKTGVMLRQGLTSGARNVMTGLTAANGPTFHFRSTNGGDTGPGIVSPVASVFPTWSRLIRQAGVLNAYHSTDGASWTHFGFAPDFLVDPIYVGIATASINLGNEIVAILDNFSVTTLPPFVLADIGTATTPCVFDITNGVYTITAHNEAIYDTADDFCFIYWPLTGDVEISGRISRVDPSAPHAESGFTLRQTLNDNAANVFTGDTAQQGFSFKYRSAAGGSTTGGSQGAPSQIPAWVRLRRQGGIITGATSADGVTWNDIGSTNDFFTDPIFVGIAADSDNFSASSTSTIENFRMITF